MKLVLDIILIIAAVLITALVLLQQRGEGVGKTFGGGGAFYGTRRGLEKQMFYATIVLSVILIVGALLKLRA